MHTKINIQNFSVKKNDDIKVKAEYEERSFMDLIYPSQEEIDKLCNLLQGPNKVNSIYIYEKSYRHVKDLSKLYELLKTNTQVTKLKINDMLIKDLTPIVEMLKVNKSIIYLDLQDNLINEEKDLIPLIDIILNNNTLKDIDLRNNGLKNITPLNEALDKNKNLKVKF